MAVEEPYGGHFPGDSCVLGYLLTPEADVNTLKCDEWLSTHLLDLIIQRAGILRPDNDADPFVPLLGSLGAETFISSLNLKASLKRAQVKIKGVEKESGVHQETSTKVKPCDATANFN